MPLPLEKLLAPITPDNPSGDDVSYDPAFQELDTLVAGKPETQFSAAEPADWSQVRAHCLALLERSKHLRLIVTLSAAVLRTEGLSGFRDGLKVIEGDVRGFWPTLYPRLDPEDNNDPTERINILASLSMPLGVTGDPYNIIEGLRKSPLSASAQMGRFSLDDVTRSQTGEAGAPSVAQVDASFLDTRPDVLQERHAAVSEALALVKSLGSAMSDLVGAERMPNFDLLNSTLREIEKAITRHLPSAEGAPAPEAAGPADSAPAAAPAAARGPGISGGIETREDVIRAIDMICAYYKRREPCSPVPLLLERAKRVAQMDFLTLVQDLAPEALAQINLIAGIK
ncbi:MAG TPA: type VI secretion system protein TssA [Chthoniobacteraceae bacterium]